MTSVTINGVAVSVNDGIIIKDKYTEKLDTAMITIPYVDKLNLSPFDFVAITDDRFTKYFVIDTWVEETVGFNPMKYTYNTNLISETIKLQKVVFPNIAITQPIGATQKTIGQMLTRYFTRYIKPQYDELTLSSELSNLTDVCPEEMFNRPTAFEVFNTLLAKKNAIVRITNHVIGMVQLDQYGNEIDEDKIYYDNGTQAINDYSNRLDVQVNNGISEENNVETFEFLTLRGDDDSALFTDDNMQIILPKPIYEAGRLYCTTQYDDGGGNVATIKLDLTNYLVEKQVYDTYLVGDILQLQGGNYKRHALYYVRGDNKIQGLNYSEKIWIANSNIALYTILQIALKNVNPSYSLPYNEGSIKNYVMFQYWYKTSESYRFNAIKDNNYNATLIDNQTETQVDSLNFGKTEQQKLNRLGNKARVITGTFKLTDTIPQLSDYIDDYILAEREIVYYKDFADFRGYLYKDYVIKNMFYGLNSKKRSTQIATESVVRNEIVNYECKFELDSTNTNKFLPRYILMPLAGSNPNMIYPDNWYYYEYPSYAFIRTYDGNTCIQGEDSLLITSSSYAMGKSNLIHMQFKDNFSAGMRLNGNVTGGTKQEYIKYVNNYGECDKLSVFLATNKNDLGVSIDTFSRYKEIADNLPLITNTKQMILENYLNTLFDIDINLNKDNRETLAITFNFNYKDTENVIIGDFSQYTGMGMYYNSPSVKICYSTTDEYEIGDEYGKGTELQGSQAYINSTEWANFMNNDISKFDDLELITSLDTSSWKSWGIVDNNNRLILGINKGNQNSIPKKIYLNCQLKNY